MSDTERIKERLNIVDVVSGYVQVSPAGSHYKGLCPFHQEKTPSFTVNPQLQIFKCFGCGRGGDLFSFLQEIDHLTFPEALSKAADLAGVELTGRGPKNEKLEQQKKQIQDMHTLAAQYYHHILLQHKTGEKGRAYAQKRGMTAHDLQTFQVGYAPHNYTNMYQFLQKKGFSTEAQLLSGLVVERKGKIIDKFRDRLLQPIFDLQGQVIGFSGRYLGTHEQAPKYLNSAESVVFKKNAQLYSLYHAKEAIRKEGFAIFVEGNIDIISSHRAGVAHVVAPLGTSLTPQQVRLLKRFTDMVYFAFDNDSAGQKAIERGIAIVEEAGLRHKVVDVSPFQDADEMILQQKDAWPERIAEAQDTIDYLLQKYTHAVDMRSASGKQEVYTKIIGILQTVKNPITLQHAIQETSLLLEMQPDQIKQDIERKSKTYRPLLLEEEKEENAVQKSSIDPISREKTILSGLLQSGKPMLEERYEIIFSKPEYKELFLIACEVQEIFSDEIIETLEEPLQQIYADLFVENLSYLGDLEHAIPLLAKRLFREVVNQKILHLRSELAEDQENENLLKDLQHYTSLLRD